MNTVKIVIAAVILMLTACAKDAGTNRALLEAASAELLPDNAQLAEIYNRSCRSCHVIAATGAPLTGDKKAWDFRMNKGMDVLLNNVVNGYGGMPPFGLCMDCGPEEFEGLILFMAGERG